MKCYLLCLNSITIGRVSVVDSTPPSYGRFILRCIRLFDYICDFILAVFLTFSIHLVMNFRVKPAHFCRVLILNLPGRLFELEKSVNK